MHALVLRCGHQPNSGSRLPWKAQQYGSAQVGTVTIGINLMPGEDRLRADLREKPPTALLEGLNFRATEGRRSIVSELDGPVVWITNTSLLVTIEKGRPERVPT